jgi:3-oxoacyl-[acyl-carrier protein] reductase
MELGLKNKIVFVAGSSSGIGLSIAGHFLQEGAKVVITGRNPEQLEVAYNHLKDKHPHEIIQIQADLSKENEIKRAIGICVEHFGRIDIAIANIGSGKEVKALDFDEESLRGSFEKNLLGSLLLTKHVSLKMIEQKSGVIILISSIVSLEDIEPAPIAYSAHKAALNAAAKQFSRQLGASGIRVNAIIPGNIFFPGGTWERRFQDDPHGTKGYIDSEVPLKVLGKPEDVANLALFLASDKASFITGSMVVVDGGQTRSF